MRYDLARKICFMRQLGFIETASCSMEPADDLTLLHRHYPADGYRLRISLGSSRRLLPLVRMRWHFSTGALPCHLVEFIHHPLRSWLELVWVIWVTCDDAAQGLHQNYWKGFGIVRLVWLVLRSA
jgi:hypothetical protein